MGGFNFGKLFSGSPGTETLNYGGTQNGGGSNQFVSAGGYFYNPQSGAGGALPTQPSPGTATQAISGGSVPGSGPYSGYPYFGGGQSLTPIAGSVGAADKLPGGAGTTPTLDPRFTQLMDSFLGGQLGSGISPYNLSAYLPSTGGTTQAGQVSAPLTPEMQQLQQFLMSGQGGGAGAQSMENLANYGGLNGPLGNLAATGGLTGMLGSLAQNGGQTGALGNIGQTGGLNPILQALFSGPNGQMGGTLGNLQNTGGLTGELGNLFQTGGLTGPLGQMAQTGDPISALPEWQAMVGAEQTGISQNEANLKEQFGSMGNLSSSPAANAMSLYLAQTSADQNANLTQAQTTALENAQNRKLQAGEFGVNTASTLGQFSVGEQLQAGEFGSNLFSQLGQQGVQNQLSSLLPSLQTQLSALQGGVNTQLSADTSALGAQGSASSQLLGLGGQTGQYTQGLDEQSIQALMQEYFQTTPQNNPLLNMDYGLATSFPPTYTKQGGVGSAIVGGLGSILGEVGGAASGYANTAAGDNPLLGLLGGL